MTLDEVGEEDPGIPGERKGGETVEIRQEHEEHWQFEKDRLSKKGKVQMEGVGPGCRHQLVCREQDGVSLLLPENQRAKDLGRKLVFFWRPLRCFCFNHTRRVSIEERTIEALKNGTQAVISDGEIKTLYKDLCSGRVKSGLMYLWHNPGVSLKLKQRLKPLMFHFADAQVDELTERIGSCSGIDKLIKKGEFQFLDLVFDVLVPEVQRSLQQ
ncbi:uncharacterized protein [Nothobranchius furzeri]|uniref:uncharacterized protein n=1 Tax=Nothobranchius furzeri TaxID=105023 RepID=UPI003904AFB6